MKKLLTIVVAFCSWFGASSVYAQNKIELYSDAARSSCEIVDQGGTALKVVYVFMTGPQKSTGVRFKAPRPACWTGATFVGNITQYVAIGSSEVDWSVAFGVCLQPPILIGQINFVATGAGQSCCEMTAAPSFEFVHTDCNFAEFPVVVGQKVVINPNATCSCQLPLATESSTWGRVKSLYR